MSPPAVLAPSPVSAAFVDIQNCQLDKLRLTAPEKATLRAAEDNPIEYTLAKGDEAKACARVLIKVLAQASGPSGPSLKVSRVTELLPDAEAMPLIHSDPMGVMTHFVIAKLYEVIVCLKEMKEGSLVCIGSVFYNDDGVLNEDWRPLLRILHLGGAGDPFAQRGASLCLCYILIAGCASQKLRATQTGPKLKSSSVEEPLQALVTWVASQLQSSASSSLTLVSPTLMVLMGVPEARKSFQNCGGIGYISRHLRVRNGAVVKRGKETHTGASVQQLYELCYCLWTLTYELHESLSVRTHFARDGAIPALVDLVAVAPREKVVRVALSALSNLADYKISASDEGISEGGEKKQVNSATFLTEMIGCGLIKSIDLMKERQWTDPDMVADLDKLHTLLHDNFNEMTTWDVYEAEVESGHLSWGILHTATFFKENARAMEGPDGNFRVVRLLTKLVLSDDDEVAAVACFDIGEFSRHYPNGRIIAKRLGAKDVVMGMIDHENVELQRQALSCVSKMLVQNWEAVK